MKESSLNRHLLVGAAARFGSPPGCFSGDGGIKPPACIQHMSLPYQVPGGVGLGGLAGRLRERCKASSGKGMGLGLRMAGSSAWVTE